MKIIITGGHTGIGLELLKKLVSLEHEIGLIVRSPARAKVLSLSIRNHPNVTFFHGDLSVRSDIDRVGKEIQHRFAYVDRLFNNAGVLLDGLYYSQQGNEMHFEVNTLAPYQLTQQLLPLLRKSEDGVVINTVTDALHTRQGLDLLELLTPSTFRKLFGAYMNSKYALLLVMNDSARKEKAVRFISVGPGPNKTAMTSGNGMPVWLKPLRYLFFSSPTRGANYLYQAAFDEKYHSVTGAYFNGGKLREVSTALHPDEVNQIINR